MGDVEEVPRKGIRQAVEFPHSPDEAINVHDGYRSGAADNRCRRGRDGNGARAITIGEGTGIRALTTLPKRGLYRGLRLARSRRRAIKSATSPPAVMRVATPMKMKTRRESGSIM